MGESKQLYVVIAIFAFLFLSLAGAAGMWIYAEQRIAQDSRDEAARQVALADVARRELSAHSKALNEMRGQLDAQRQRQHFRRRIAQRTRHAKRAVAKPQGPARRSRAHCGRHRHGHAQSHAPARAELSPSTSSRQ